MKHLGNLFVMAALLVTAAFASACGDEVVVCEDCQPGTGLVKVELGLTSADILRVVAEVSGAGLTTPVVQDLAINAGPPRTATGSFADVPEATNYTVALEAFPALVGGAEDTVVIYRGSTTVDVEDGLAATANVTLNPVYGDVTFTATFPAGDPDIADVSYVQVTVTGNRITHDPVFYLTVAGESATGTIDNIPVGATRTFTVQAYDADNVKLFEGSGDHAVTEGGDSVTVPLTNVSPPAGSINVTGSFCEPDCSAAECGDDGCGGSCGGCKSGATCLSGLCNTPVNWCRYQFPNLLTATSGDTVTFYGRVYHAGITDISTGVDVSPLLKAQVGLGGDGTDPVTNGSWTWYDAGANPGWNGSGVDANNDEYQAAVQLNTVGSFDAAYRFSVDGGHSWTYCDGGDEGSSNGYSATNAGAITVN